MSCSSKTSFSLATFGAGCFWCIEAVFEKLKGVDCVESGYMGGIISDPTYREVCSGTSGYAEVVQIQFDLSTITYETLLYWLWRSHDPTSLNRQGADSGTQYRSVIFYHDMKQRNQAEISKASIQKQFNAPIVTEISAASTFYRAENYHQGYYRQNSNAPYCQLAIKPKLEKLGLVD